MLSSSVILVVFVATILLLIGITFGATPVVISSYQLDNSNDIDQGQAYYQQQFIVTSNPSVPLNNIAISIFTSKDTGYEKVAYGTIYLFSQPVPNTVHPSTIAAYCTVAHFCLGSATAVDSIAWIFAPTVTLQAGQTYYFYTISLTPNGVSLSQSNTDITPSLKLSIGINSPYNSQSNPLNFVVEAGGPFIVGPCVAVWACNNCVGDATTVTVTTAISGGCVPVTAVWPGVADPPLGTPIVVAVESVTQNQFYTVTCNVCNNQDPLSCCTEQYVINEGGQPGQCLAGHKDYLRTDKPTPLFTCTSLESTSCQFTTPSPGTAVGYSYNVVGTDSTGTITNPSCACQDFVTTSCGGFNTTTIPVMPTSVKRGDTQILRNRILALNVTHPERLQPSVWNHFF